MLRIIIQVTNNEYQICHEKRQIKTQEKESACPVMAEKR